MKDYLEECLDNAVRLLEQIKQTDQEVTALPPAGSGAVDAIKAENAWKAEEAVPSERHKNISKSGETVDNLATQVNRRVNAIDDREFEPDTVEKTEPGRECSFLSGVEEWERSGWNGGVLKPADSQRGGVSPEETAGRDQSGCVLAAELRQLDWAVSPQAGGMLSEGRENGFPVSLPSPQRQRIGQTDLAGALEDGWKGIGGLTGVRSSSGEGQLWAEQADRVFRRDSRRYDGGFYLY